MAPESVRFAGFRTLLYKEILRFWKVSFQTVGAPVLTAVLYLLIFSHVLDRHVTVYGDVPYTVFLVPGLVMMSIIQNAYGNISSSFFGAKFGRHVEELLVSPMPNWVILGGYVAGGVLRGLMVGAIVLTHRKRPDGARGQQDITRQVRRNPDEATVMKQPTVGEGVEL